mmetsp:Transcript_17985/g.42003  ORF Transcript_17985/g.42003 Transcript_17985/m.42003 type:complete len:134 (-) Transcript_17985:44-445(-)
MAMLPLAAGACSAPCASAVAAVAGGSIAAPVAVVALTTVASVHAAKKVYKSLYAGEDDGQSKNAAADEEEEFEDAEEEEEEEEGKPVAHLQKSRVVSTVASAAQQEAGAEAPRPVVATGKSSGLGAAQGSSFL